MPLPDIWRELLNTFGSERVVFEKNEALFRAFVFNLVATLGGSGALFMSDRKVEMGKLIELSFHFD